MHIEKLKHPLNFHAVDNIQVDFIYILHLLALAFLFVHQFNSRIVALV